MLRVCWAIFKRAIKHDNSKFNKNEITEYVKLDVRKLKNTKYGSAEYFDLIKVASVGTQIHYSVNSHHPEFYKFGFGDMSYLDRLEMLADWKAASFRSGGDFNNSINKNTKRYKIKSFDKRSLIRDAQEIGLCWWPTTQN